MSSSPRFPKLVAFDLDYTLWNLWIDTHISGPLRRKEDTLNEVLDRYDDTICFYAEVPGILHQLKAEGVVIAACSRTHAPALAREALSLLLVPPPAPGTTTTDGDASPTAQPAIEFFDQLEIYPGSKLTHFRKLHEKTGLPYSEMLFYDDEPRNQEVGNLGTSLRLSLYVPLTQSQSESESPPDPDPELLSKPKPKPTSYVLCLRRNVLLGS